MLSRVADSLFWLSRNVERAETIARILDVTSARAMDTASGAAKDERLWSATIACAAFTQPRTETWSLSQALAWCVFEYDNASSIRSCVRYARTNGIGIRALLSTEVWLALNAFYLYVEEQDPQRVMRTGPSRFLRRVRDAAQGFAGVCDATLTHADAWNYLQIGRFLERAYMTSRMLAANEPDLEPWSEAQRLLEMCCATEPFMQTMQSTPETGDALTFMIASTEFPRSIRFCIREIDAALRRLSKSPAGTYANEAERLVAHLRARLDFTPVHELVAPGVRPWALTLSSALADIGNAIQQSYTPQPAAVL